jgi:NADH dehydrogenase
MNHKRVVIIGGGFGGLSLANELARKEIDVILIDKNNFHTFQPLLYQVATGGLEPDSIVYPIRRAMRKKKNIRFRMAEVLSIDPANSSISTTIGQVHYDFLVIATGSTNNFFNFEPIKNQFFPLKSITDALDIRSYLMQTLEKVLTIGDEKLQENSVNVAIIGGGPAGIEIAGALAEMRAKVLPKDFPEFDFSKMHIYLFEAVDRLLSAMSTHASDATLEYLRDMNVHVMLSTKVHNYENNQLFLEDGTSFQAATVIWTAGVKGATIEGITSDAIVAGNRIKVNEYNQVYGTNNIFAIGDVAAHITESSARGLPMVAQVAIQQGKVLGQNIVKIIKDESLIPFEYHDKGSMATIGRNKAVVDLPKWKFKGHLAWFVWMFIHLISLVGFRNKVITLIDWTQNYFSYDRPLGIIIRKYRRSE